MAGISLEAKNKQVKSGRVFYGWWIVSGGFSLQMIVGSLMIHSFTAYFPLLQAQFGWSRALLSGAFALSRAESGILGPLQGWLIDRFGPQGYGQGRYGAFWRRVHNVQLYRFRPGLLPNLPANGSGFQHRRVLDGGDDGGELVREAARCGYGHCHERLRDWRFAGARCGVVSHHPRLETDRLYLRGFHHHESGFP